MSYCPNCRQRFEGLTECPDDRVALVGELPYQTIDGPTSTWVEIETVGTEEEAMLLRGFLEAEGIPCQVESLRIESMPMTLGAMGEIRIYVSAENEEAALNLLGDRDSELGTLPAEGAVITDEGPAEVDEESESVLESEEP